MYHFGNDTKMGIIWADSGKLRQYDNKFIHEDTDEK